MFQQWLLLSTEFEFSRLYIFQTRLRQLPEFDSPPVFQKRLCTTFMYTSYQSNLSANQTRKILYSIACVRSYGPCYQWHFLLGASNKRERLGIGMDIKGQGTVLKVLGVAVWLVFCSHVIESQTFNFSITSGNMQCENGMLRCSGAAHSIEQGLRLTADIGKEARDGEVGGLFYTDPVRILDRDTGRAASFSTAFTFQIGLNSDNHGDGLAFVMIADGSFRGKTGVALGIYNSDGTEGTKTFCVEFDTFWNVGIDYSANHVGLNLESVRSVQYVNLTDKNIYLAGGRKITSWIDYSFPSTTLDIRVSYSDERPEYPLLTVNHLNLSNIVDEMMFLGFGASTGLFSETHDLLSWNLSTSGIGNSEIPNNSVPVGAPQPPTNDTNVPVTSPPGSQASGTEGPVGMFRPSASRPRSKIPLIVGVSTGVLFLLLCICFGLGLSLYRFTVPRELEAEYGVVAIPSRFTYKQLSIATNGFSEESKLGQGGSSSVYRGRMDSTGQVVAVKRVSSNYQHGEKDFEGELSVLSRLRHRHLVKLLGWCSYKRNFLLVYELVANGSLDRRLFRTEENETLSWQHRLSIVKGVADALAYLHVGFSEQVIHRDIKSSNVLLDEKMNAIVGDFGLSRLLDHSKRTQTTELAGTLGYIAPEAALSGQVSAKTDVYAFGMLVLEIACGRPAILVENTEKTLLDWVWSHHADGRILDVADPRLEGNFPDDEMQCTLLMGLICSHPDPDARPSMREVGYILDGHFQIPSVPRSKPVLNFVSESSRAKFIKKLSNVNFNQIVPSSIKALPAGSSHSSSMSKNKTDHSSFLDRSLYMNAS